MVPVGFGDHLSWFLKKFTSHVDMTPDDSRQGLDLLLRGTLNRTQVQSVRIPSSNSLDGLNNSHGVVD